MKRLLFLCLFLFGCEPMLEISAPVYLNGRCTVVVSCTSLNRVETHKATFDNCMELIYSQPHPVGCVGALQDLLKCRFIFNVRLERSDTTVFYYDCGAASEDAIGVPLPAEKL